MNYVLCLAGGIGTRMNNPDLPKQFIKINGKPIIIYTIENILKVNKIDKIIIVCNRDYIKYMNELLDKYQLNGIEVTEGGKDRLHSTINGINFIKEKYGICDDDIFIAHDSVRPFTSTEIFQNGIKAAHENKAATTINPLTETLVETNDDGLIFKLHPRNHLFNDQSPQIFNINYFLECTAKIPENILDTFTDLCSNVTYVGGTVTPVMGDRNNIKITTPIDLVIAKSLIESDANFNK